MNRFRTLALLGAGLLVLPACDAVAPSAPDLGMAVAPSADARGGQAKVDVCHASSGAFNLISVAAPAVDAHRRHGDALPSEAVPGMDGFAFDEACAPVAVVTVPACLQGLYAEAEAGGLDIPSLAPWTITSDTEVPWGFQVRLTSSTTGLALLVDTLYSVHPQCHLYTADLAYAIYSYTSDGTGDENLLDYIRSLAE